MSDLAAAAAAMGVPEALVKRSAEARAKAAGASVDEILAAWAGGAPAPATATASVEPPESEDATREPTGAEPVAPAAAISDVAPPTSPEPETAPPPPAAPTAPPILVGARQGLGVLVSGSLGLLILSLLLSVFLPSTRQPTNGIRSSHLAFSAQARDGQAIYASQGCGTCHTQLIRNVVADVGLGPVTVDDTNQIIGYRRIGPDLAAIGHRIADTAALMDLLSGSGNHPPATGLSDNDLADLVAYLRESR